MCSDLIDALDAGIPAGRIRMSPLADRARALLAQPVYRAMCAELAEELVNEYGYCTEWEKGLPLCESNVSELLTRARRRLKNGRTLAPRRR
jgi:hypothetical protein